VGPVPNSPGRGLDAKLSITVEGRGAGSDKAAGAYSVKIDTADTAQISLGIERCMACNCKEKQKS